MSTTTWIKNEEHFDWMQKCLTCWKMCEEFISWSIENEKFINTLNACRDVTEMCSQCIKFEAQRSPFFKNLCEVCADVCEKFASEIGRHEDENGIIPETINSCRTFARACREVVEKQINETVNLKDNFISKGGDKI